MECMKCKGKMIEAKLNGNAYGTVYLSNKKKGVLESEHRTGINCYVCTDCGYVELKAESPQKLLTE